MASQRCWHHALSCAVPGTQLTEHDFLMQRTRSVDGRRALSGVILVRLPVGGSMSVLILVAGSVNHSCARMPAIVVKSRASGAVSHAARSVGLSRGGSGTARARPGRGAHMGRAAVLLRAH